MVERNRRKHPRFPLVIRVSHVLDNHYQYYYSRDLSFGGMFLETRSPYKVGAKVELDFSLPERRTRVRVKGEVVRVIEADVSNPDQTPGMGVAFSYVDPESREEFESFLAELARGG